MFADWVPPTYIYQKGLLTQDQFAQISGYIPDAYKQGSPWPAEALQKKIITGEDFKAIMAALPGGPTTMDVVTYKYISPVVETIAEPVVSTLQTIQDTSKKIIIGAVAVGVGVLFLSNLVTGMAMRRTKSG